MGRLIPILWRILPYAVPFVVGHLSGWFHHKRTTKPATPSDK